MAKVHTSASAPRFRIETTPDGGEILVIPAQRRVFQMAFFVIWLAPFAAGLIIALQSPVSPLLPIFLIASVLGALFVATMFAWMMRGRETLRVVGSDLEVSARVLGLVRSRLYGGAEIRGLSSNKYMWSTPYGKSRMDVPVLWAPGSGVVKFAFDAQTIYAGVGLDEREGRQVVDWLKQRLPTTATDPA